MNYSDLSNEIENIIPKYAKANYQYVMLRFLLLRKTAKKSDIIESLQKYNQNKENNDYSSVFLTLINSKLNIIEKNKNFVLSNVENLTDEEIYDLVSKCDDKIQEMKENNFGTNPTDQYLTFKDAAKIILKEKNRPMHYIEITNIALSKNLIITEGSTPNQTMSADIRRDIEKNGTESYFIKTAESTFSINYKYILNSEKFEQLHTKFLKYIYDKSLEKGYTEEEAKFVNFSNKYLIEVEILYKNQVVDNARNILEIEKWGELKKTPGKIIEKLKEICEQKICKTLITPPKGHPKEGQTQILYKLEGNQINDFEKKISKLFLESTDNEIFSKNFDNLMEFLKINEFPRNSQFWAYISFIADKEKYIPLRIQDFDKVLQYYENYEQISGFTWKKYNSYLTLIKALKVKLSEKYPEPNTIETHSYLWIVSNILKKTMIKEEPVGQKENNDENYAEYFKILENKNQFIFYGPPGTGKTWNAKQISNEFIEKSEVANFLEPEYENYIKESLEKVSNYNNFKFYLFGDNNFSIKNPEKKIINGRFYFIQSGKSIPERCEITVKNETIEFLSNANPVENKFLIVINSDTKNFLVIPHNMIVEKFQLDPNQDLTGKSQHKFIVNIFKDKAEYYFLNEKGEEQFQDCSELLHNFEYMFNKNNIPCKFFEKITFHQSFSYEEFIEGIRPEAGPDNKFITYPVKSGIFKKICSCARADQKQRYVLLIDEINRGNISKIFGELITLIEKDKRGDPLRLPYSKEMFEVPPNLYVIGTMNTADRSLVKLDIALRRRFAFVELMPKSEVLDDIEIRGISVRGILDKINQRIDEHGMREYQIGHSYFMLGKETVQDISNLQYIFAYEIIPLLKEYFFNDVEKLKEILKNQFIDWSDMTIIKKWQEDEEIFLEYLNEFMK
jgi:hypothetical protein